MSLPARLQRIADLLASSPPEFKIQALIDYALRLPELPDRFDVGAMERVPECQSQFFVVTEVAADRTVRLYFAAPREAATTRGYAAILHEGLDGLPAEEILAVPNDFYRQMGLEGAITPLRLRGMGATLARVKRQIREQLPAR